MDIDKTIHFLTEAAAQHDARLAKLEENNVLIQQALLRLAEHQGFLQTSLEETQKLVRDTQVELKELGEKTDQRIANLVSAIAKLSNQRPN